MSQQNASNPNAPTTVPAPDANRDAITGTPGAHPIGVGVGAIGGGAAVGAAAGMVAGPIGAVAGAAVGAVVGGLAGKSAAEAINPTLETNYWRTTHSTMPYASAAYGYEEYAPAYRYGWESSGRSTAAAGKTFESMEADLGRGWNHAKGTSRLAWDQAKHATRDAWNRVQFAVRGDAKRIGD